MAGVRKKPKKSGKYQAWFFDFTGKRKFFTGTQRRIETLKIAQRLEDEHKQIRLGYRPAPKSAQKHRNKLFEEATNEYLAWGRMQGGRRGGPWGKSQGCTAMTIAGRKGWTRVLKDVGYEEKFVTLAKELT